MADGMHPQAEGTRAQLERLLECTRQIQACIEQGDWLGAAELDAARLRSLQGCCAGLEPSTCPPDVLAALVEMVKINDSLIGAVQRRQDALLDDAQAIGLGRRAAAAYSST
jgi:hypothetical protein